MPRRNPVPIVSVSEFGEVQLPPGLDAPATRERLQTIALRAGFAAFELRGSRLFAQGVVGVVDAGSVVVEILPKVGPHQDACADTAFLGDLLRFAGDGRAPALSPASIRSGEGGLLELLYAWAARLLAANVREGLPRRYVEREEQSTSVRGRVDLRRLAARHPGRTLDLTVRHAPLGTDNPVSRLLSWLVRTISVRTRSMRTRRLCLALHGEFAGIAERAPDAATLDGIVLPPFEARWEALVDFARILLGNGRLDPARAGEASAVAILFTLHDLFEGALRRILAAGLPGEGLSLLGGRTGHLLSGPGRPPLIRLRPDFRIGQLGTPVTLVAGDAKWKLAFDKPGTVRLGEDDAYQVTAYAAALHVDRAFIAFPVGPGAATLRLEPFTLAGLERPLDVIGVHLPTLVRMDAAGEVLRQAFCRAAVGRTDHSVDGALMSRPAAA